MKLTDSLYSYPESGMLDSNTYIVRGDKSAVVIDPGFDQYLPELLRAIEADGIRPEDIKIITNTHLHLDHYWGNEAFKRASGAKILIHPLQKKFYNTNVFEIARFFGFKPVEFKEDGCLEGDKISLGDIEIEFIPSPGHSADSICFYSMQARALVSGDVIFAGNTGRVDVPGGSVDDLRESIKRLSRLDIEYLLPGHLNLISGSEKVKNNFELIEKHVLPWL